MNALTQAALIGFALTMVFAWVGVVFLSPSSMRGPSTPARRIAAARAWLYAPFWLPAVALGVAFAPSAISALFGGADHCAVDAHHHMCFVHPPIATTALAAAAAGCFLVLFLATGIACFAARVRKQERLARSLLGLARPAPCGEGALLLDTDEPVALTVGMWRPRVVVSAGLLRRVTPAAVQAILAHEAAHVRRRDTLASVVDHLIGKLYPSVVSAPLLADISLGTEQACDQAAATRVGALGVARALGEVLRLNIIPAPALGLSIGSSSIEARVAFLLGDKPPSRLLPTFALGSLLLALAASPIHAAVELLLCTLVH